MISISNDDLEKTLKDFSDSEAVKSNITVEFDNVNEVDPLVLLRTFHGTTSPDTLMGLAEDMLNGHTITFKINDDVVKTVAYNKGNGNRLSTMLIEEPYLCDSMLNAVYAIMLKKLTPHLNGSK